MMAFKYRFETLLKVRKIQDNIAQQAFGEAQKHYYRLVAMKEHLISRRDDLREELMSRMKRGLNSTDVKTYYDYVFHLGQGLEQINEHIRIALRQVDEKREELVNKKRAHKAIKRLKEIHHTRFDEIVRKKDMNFLDEIAILKGWR